MENPLNTRNLIFLLLVPSGILLFYEITKKKATSIVHTLEETPDSWIVKTENVDAPLVDTSYLTPHVTVTFGQVNSHVVIKTIEYSKEKYSKEDIDQILEEKLAECPRCTVPKS